MAVVTVGLVVLAGCAEPPPPAPPPPPVAAAPTTPKPKAPAPLPEAPEDVAAFPEQPPASDDVTTAAALTRLLLSDPQHAERLLARLPTPDGWQVAILSQLAVARGERALTKDRSTPLPEVPVPGAGGATAGPAFVAAEAVVLRASAPVKKTKKRGPPAALATLPFGTPVELLPGDDGASEVTVRVRLATRALYGEVGPAPVTVESRDLEGLLPRASLTAVAPTLEALVAAARAEPDDGPGRERAVVLWRRALRLSHAEVAREGLLRAAAAARRAPEVVEAALARNLAPARGLLVAASCRGELPKAKWLSATPPPKTVPADACLMDLSLRAACDDDPPKQRAAAQARAAWRAAQGLEAKPTARFVVDARSPRLAFLTRVPLERVDGCADFEELRPAAWQGTVRRLALPLGTKDLEVLVPLPQAEGVEYAVVSATTEGKAVRWLHSRGRFKWTVGPRGQLRASLSAGDLGFELERDVAAVTWALPPPRTCDCD